MLELIRDDYDSSADAMTEAYLAHLAGKCDSRECPWCPEPGYSEQETVETTDDGTEPPY